ncbi:hypothetical protein BpHYR1_043014 [Brachionus plicatilis]|uniref:Uncharacterized protein n=1 Tax=Brachionus plicatilis TaxID=10195 RepID=A0A3M7QM52_BRAPC|nr:hypothetical protein BpHYR1_043014 [Brachionus plicatilis]
MKNIELDIYKKICIVLHFKAKGNQKSIKSESPFMPKIATKINHNISYLLTSRDYNKLGLFFGTFKQLSTTVDPFFVLPVEIALINERKRNRESHLRCSKAQFASSVIDLT